MCNNQDVGRIDSNNYIQIIRNILNNYVQFRQTFKENTMLFLSIFYLFVFRYILLVSAEEERGTQQLDIAIHGGVSSGEVA